MKAKTMSKLEAENKLTTEILNAVKASGLDESAVKAVLSRIIDVIEENED